MTNEITTNEIRKTIDLKAPVARVWQALTDHEQFGAWFRARLDGPFIPGEVTTGNMTYPGFEHVKWLSRTEAMEPQSLFSFRWPHPADMNADFGMEPSTLVEFRLQPTDTGTRLTIVESGFDAIPEDRRMKALRDNEGGWAEQTRNIEAYLVA